MTPIQKNVAYVVTVVGAVLLSVAPTREFIIELTLIIALMVYFGLRVVWNVIMSVGTNVLLGIVTGVAFVAAAIVSERRGRRARDRAYTDATEDK